MSNPIAVHGSFTIERIYPARPERVFKAFSTLEGKTKWFGPPPTGEWVMDKREFDFRVGGKEELVGTWKNGMVTHFDCRYFDILENQRIVYAYDLYAGGKKLSVSLATITMEPEGQGTRLTVTEQGVFLDGYDDAGSREKGTISLIDRLGESLAE